ncbi:MAG: hypothetical protein JRI23_28190 [Deltaproteobacteria bacterium]|jgi:hypothetical protein|nr:hypothetical protein [Deltaproteobacteria bacterium]MBW2535972.1 hypothetical protein [Deltaproteobacteria bacterium]
MRAIALRFGPLLVCWLLVLAAASCSDEEASQPAVQTSTGGSAGIAGAGGSTSAGGTGGTAGSAQGGGGAAPWTGVPTDRPLRLLFIGNSFTHQGPIPHLVRDMAAGIGWPSPEVDYSAPGGETLAGHRSIPETLDLVDAGGWDFVVLQDLSTRPTDDAGDPAAFKADATWFYDRIKSSSSDAQVVLYETWARHPDHGIYPGTFVDPAQMQAQLRLHYNDAADSYIPANATATVTTDVEVAPVGDAWEAHLAEASPLRLHGSDDYHAGPNGQYLNALVLYATIYGVVTTGVSDLSLPSQDAARLRATADATTGIAQQPPPFPAPPLAVGQTIRIDFGTIQTTAAGWNVLTDCTTGSAFDLRDSADTTTGVDVSVTDAFSGANEQGLAGNTLGYPTTVSTDVCWTGSFDGHAQALVETAAVTVDDLDDGQYEVQLFASRSGDDGGLGRLTRYSLGSDWIDVEIADNTGDTATFVDVQPDAAGRLVLDVAVSPAGSGRFGYLGALVLTKTAD